jgi:hypothetical protein
MKYDLITIHHYKQFKNKKLGNPTFKIKATQEYISEANIGHYKYYIADGKENNILKVSYSCGAARQGKINLDFLEEELERFWKEYKQYTKYLDELDKLPNR